MQRQVALGDFLLAGEEDLPLPIHVSHIQNKYTQGKTYKYLRNLYFLTSSQKSRNNNFIFEVYKD